MEGTAPVEVNKGKVLVARGNETEAPTSQTLAARPTSSAEYVFSEIKQHKKEAMLVGDPRHRRGGHCLLGLQVHQARRVHIGFSNDEHG